MCQLRKTNKHFKEIVNDIIHTRYLEVTPNRTYDEVIDVPIATKIDALSRFGPDYSAPYIVDFSDTSDRIRAFDIFKAIAYNNTKNDYFASDITTIGNGYRFKTQPINFDYLMAVIKKINNLYVGNSDLIYKSLYQFFSKPEYNGNPRYQQAKLFFYDKIKDIELRNDPSRIDIKPTLLNNPLFNKSYVLKTLNDDVYPYSAVKIKRDISYFKYCWSHLSKNPAYIEDFQQLLSDYGGIKALKRQIRRNFTD